MVSQVAEALGLFPTGLYSLLIPQPRILDPDLSKERLTGLFYTYLQLEKNKFPAVDAEAFHSLTVTETSPSQEGQSAPLRLILKSVSWFKM